MVLESKAFHFIQKIKWEFNEEKDKVNGKGEGIYYTPYGKKEKRRRRIIGEKGYWEYF